VHHCAVGQVPLLPDVTSKRLDGAWSLQGPRVIAGSRG